MKRPISYSFFLILDLPARARCSIKRIDCELLETLEEESSFKVSPSFSGPKTSAAAKPLTRRRLMSNNGYAQMTMGPASSSNSSEVAPAPPPPADDASSEHEEAGSDIAVTTNPHSGPQRNSLLIRFQPLSRHDHESGESCKVCFYGIQLSHDIRQSAGSGADLDRPTQFIPQFCRCNYHGCDMACGQSNCHLDCLCCPVVSKAAVGFSVAIGVIVVLLIILGVSLGLSR